MFVATLRLKGSSGKLTYDLWRVLSQDKKIQAAVTLSGKDKSVAFTTTSVTNKEQTVVFRDGYQVGADVHIESIWEQFLTGGLDVTYVSCSIQMLITLVWCNRCTGYYCIV